MDRLEELLEKKFLKDSELLELEDDEKVLKCKYIKPYNAHYNEFLVVLNEDGEIVEYNIYLKHR